MIGQQDADPLPSLHSQPSTHFVFFLAIIFLPCFSYCGGQDSNLLLCAPCDTDSYATLPKTDITASILVSIASFPPHLLIRQDSPPCSTRQGLLSLCLTEFACAALRYFSRTHPRPPLPSAVTPRISNTYSVFKTTNLTASGRNRTCTCVCQRRSSTGRVFETHTPLPCMCR